MNLDIPDFLKISQEDRKASWAGRRAAGAPAAVVTVEEQTERLERRQRRTLRAERARLQGEIDTINGRNPPATAKLQAALDLVNRDLYLVS